MKTFPLSIIRLLPIFISAYCFAQSDLTHYVNPFIGTGGHGHTFPGAVMPFGMVQLSPDTRIDGSWDGCSSYHYSDSIIYGFTHTHLSGTGCSDYGDILLMPTMHSLSVTMLAEEKNYSSSFKHENEKATPGYYSVHLNNGADVELTCTDRAGFHKYSFSNKTGTVILDLVHRDFLIDSKIHIVNDSVVEGMRVSKAWAQNQVVYFYLKFSKRFTSRFLLTDSTIDKSTGIKVPGKSLKAEFTFDNPRHEPLFIKIGISQTSTEGARKNLEEEIPGWDFEKVKADAQAVWNKELSKIEVSGKDEENKKIFYTALYHCMIHPSLANDVDGKYLGRDFKVHQLEPGHDYYTVFSLWDTYRALHPLLTIIDQKRTADFINTFLLEYQQGGRLPVWELSSNETDCMIGYHSVSVITDAAMKGIKFDYKLALEAMKHSAFEASTGKLAYHESGYLRSEDEGENVSKTLEYSYDDWCIAQLAKLLGDTSEYNLMIESSQNWKNVYDWNSGFMRARKNCGWYSPFNPFEVNGNYTEANAWQYLFAVPHDIDGLISMMGGKEKFEAKLDSLFSVSSQTTGRDQSDISGMIGQYAHGNEPSHHMAYLYDYCDAPRKTQERVREIMNMYSNAPDGLIGNEDCGQMSAWYVMSAMGFYEVTPGYPYYAIGSPLFDSIKIHLENQKTFAITTQNNSARNMFISSMKLNGTLYDSILIPHFNIMKGGALELNMVSTPDKSYLPEVYFNPSEEISQHAIGVLPVIEARSNSFSDTLQLKIETYGKNSFAYYYIDEKNSGLSDDPKFTKYKEPFYINKSVDVYAYSVEMNGNSSDFLETYFHKTNKNYKVTYITPANSQYAGDAMTLVDEESGTKDFHNGQWQGWWGNDMQIIVDLGEETSISKVGAEFLQDQGPWIFFPRAFEVFFSSDGVSFHGALKTFTSQNLLSQNDSVQTTTLQIPVKQVKARYIKIVANNYGNLPSWHASAGQNAWIFCDEIFVE